MGLDTIARFLARREEDVLEPELRPVARDDVTWV